MKSELFCILLAASGLAAFASSDLGYLPRVGPVPLRLATALRVSTNRFVLPLPVAVAEPARVLPKVEKPTPLPALPPVEPVPVIKETANTPSFQDTPQDGVISPQMLLKYFNKPAIGTTNVAAPIDITPKPAAPANGKVTDAKGT